MRHGAARWPLLVLVLAGLGLAGCNREEGKGLFRRSAPPPNTAGERIPVLDYEQQNQVEADLQAVEVVLPPERVNPDWTQPGGSATKAMGPLALGDMKKLWEASIGEGSKPQRWLNAAPVIAANRLYTMDTEANVAAFTADTGKPLWKISLEEKAEGPAPAFGGGVSVEGDRLYATTGYGSAVALDAATGREIWRVALGIPLRSAPTVADGLVLVMSQDNRLTALNAETGEQAWQVTATLEPAGILGPGSPAMEAGTVVVGFSSGELFALRVENGRTVWQDQLARTGRSTALAALSAIVASPVIDRGRVYAIGHGGRMVAIDVASGQRAWERGLGGISTPAVAGDFLFLVTTDAQVVALTRSDGKIRWNTPLTRWKNPKKKTGGVAWFGPLLAGGRLILVSSEGEMTLIDPTTGQIVSEQKLGAAAYLPPVVANMILYVLTDDGKVRAYR